jgi:hypothetical protein
MNKRQPFPGVCGRELQTHRIPPQIFGQVAAAAFDVFNRNRRLV